jgi:hypothetical protein
MSNDDGAHDDPPVDGSDRNAPQPLPPPPGFGVVSADFGATEATPSVPARDPFAPPTVAPMPLQPPTVPLAANTAPNEPFLTKKVAKVPVIGWIAIAAVAVVGVVAALTLGGDDDENIAIEIPLPSTTVVAVTTTEAPAPTTVASTVPATTAAPETTASPTTTATTVPAGGDGRSPETAIPLGDPSVSMFTYQSPYNESAWTGSIVAISEGVAVDPASGTCLVVFATLTPTAVDGFVSNGFDAPPMNLIIDGEEQEEAYGACDYQQIEASGWTSVFDTSGTVGTEFPVYTEFQVPDSTDLDDLLLVVGAEAAGRTYFRGPVGDVPQPAVKPGAPLGVALSPVGDGAVYTYEDPFGSSTWEATYDGLVSVPVASFITEPGACFAALGTVRPVAISGVVSSGFDAPRIGLVANGRYLEGGFGQCGIDAATLAGRSEMFDATVTSGTVFPFYSEIFVPERLTGSIEAVLVGDSAFGGSAYAFGPVVVPTAPAVVPTPGNPVGGDQLPVGTLVNTGDDGLGNAWDVVVRGLIESAAVPEGRCLTLVGIATPTLSEDPTATGYSIPRMSVVIDGRQVSEGFSSCDLSAIEAAGYGDYFDAEVPVGTPYAFYVHFLVPPAIAGVPEVVLVGDGSFAKPPLVQATILGEVPPI